MEKPRASEAEATEEEETAAVGREHFIPDTVLKAPVPTKRKYGKYIVEIGGLDYGCFVPGTMDDVHPKHPNFGYVKQEEEPLGDLGLQVIKGIKFRERKVSVGQ